MGNNDTSEPWPSGSFGDDGLEKAKEAIWKRWLEKNFWGYKDAIHLTACGPCRFINTECIHEVDGIPDYYHECFEHSGQKSYEIYDLYKSEDWSKYGFPENEMPLHIKPETFIEWVLSKKTIIVPQEMKSWYKSHQAEKKTPAQGGSNKEVDKISATKEACEKIIKAICSGGREYLDDDGYIGRENFLEQVKDAMTADDAIGKFQKTAAMDAFRDSNSLKRFKRPRGRRTN